MKAMKRLVVLLPCFLTGLAAGENPLISQCVSSNRSPGQLVGYDAVTLVTVGVPSSLNNAFKRGYQAWNASNCNSTQFDGFPQFTEQSGSGRTIKIRYQSGFNPSNARACGNFGGNTIFVFQRARSADGTRVIECMRSDIFEDTVAHELGHLLGLNDQDSSTCNSFIMNQVGVT